MGTEGKIERAEKTEKEIQSVILAGLRLTIIFIIN